MYNQLNIDNNNLIQKYFFYEDYCDECMFK